MISFVKTIKKFKNFESPKMVSNRLYGHYLRSYKQIKNFQIKKIKERFPPRKRLENFLMEELSPPPQKLCIFFKKNDKRTMISAVKTFKKFKNIESPKMVSKRLYGHYLRSYEQIKNFQI